MKLSELKFEEQTLNQIADLSARRLKILALEIKMGVQPLDRIMTEIIFMSVRLDACMKLLEDNKVDYTRFDNYVSEATIELIGVADKKIESIMKFFDNESTKSNSKIIT